MQMKKCFCFALLVAVFLAACSSTPGGTASGGVGIYEDEVASIYCDTLNSYNYFISEGYKTQGYPGCTQLPENFVTWEQASVFGEVLFLRLSLDYTHGHYSIRDANGMGFILSFDFRDGSGKKTDNTTKETATTVDITRAENSMRKVTSNSTPMRILRDEFEYYYIPKGSLISITWHKNGVKFVLYGDLHTYSVINEPTIVSYLLAIPDETVEIAFSQIRQSLATK